MRNDITKAGDPLAAHRGGTNGAALAALLAAAIGAFALGAIVVLNEMEVFSAPTLYEPAGGVSGRTTLAVIVWLIAWAVLHTRWQHRNLEVSRVGLVAIVFVLLGILGTFPPFWALL